jgi:hypothetical protein
VLRGRITQGKQPHVVLGSACTQFLPSTHKKFAVLSPLHGVYQGRHEATTAQPHLHKDLGGGVAVDTAGDTTTCVWLHKRLIVQRVHTQQQSDTQICNAAKTKHTAQPTGEVHIGRSLIVRQ